MRGIENTPAGNPGDDCNRTHVHAGTIGRLIRACMKFARSHPDWRASGSVERTPDRQFRQCMVRPAPPEEDYMSDLIAELRACGTDLAESAANEIERCHARLEIDHCYRMGPEPDLKTIRETVPYEKRAKFPDAVTCREATIALIEEDLATLRARLAEVEAERDEAQYTLSRLEHPEAMMLSKGVKEFDRVFEDGKAWATNALEFAVKVMIKHARTRARAALAQTKENKDDC